jgi:hypothetical protein
VVGNPDGDGVRCPSNGPSLALHAHRCLPISPKSASRRQQDAAAADTTCLLDVVVGTRWAARPGIPSHVTVSSDNTPAGNPQSRTPKCSVVKLIVSAKVVLNPEYPDDIPKRDIPTSAELT